MDVQEDAHNELLAEKLKELAGEVEMVVLAQASMARAVLKFYVNI